MKTKISADEYTALDEATRELYFAGSDANTFLLDVEPTEHEAALKTRADHRTRETSRGQSAPSGRRRNRSRSGGRPAKIQRRDRAVATRTHRYSVARAHAVTPTTGRTSNEVQPARPPAPTFDDEVPPPSPDWDEGLVQATEAPIIIPAPPRPAPRTPTLREVYDKQTGGYGAEIDRLVAERGIMCPDGPNDVNWASHCARIERIEKLRDLEVDPNAATTIQRG